MDALRPLQPPAPAEGRPPQPLEQPGLWVFAPSRESHGGTAWWLDPDPAPGGGGLLIDCPALTQANLAFLRSRPPGQIVLTGRDGHGRCREWQRQLGWPVLVQEQEAYLLPGLEVCRRFGSELELEGGERLLWTPGPSPGACVLHVRRAQLDLLFCGRLLVPVAPAALAPLRTARTFHWRRQLESVQRLHRWLPAGSPRWLASGAALGALRGERLVACQGWQGVSDVPKASGFAHKTADPLP